MKILSMTATFGKLSHQSLTLEPGINVIHAPNEWGKSTWCAFIVAMLYGIDTKERTTATALADKERYAPWSGEPMSGRMNISWNGKNITLERSSKGRVPFGEFRAYETDSGLPLPELTAANCGQTLTGIEKSVFTKSAFIRLSDLPVTQDEALRRRLNALVTTGDESDTGDILAQKLRDLKNKCRHNKTGLLPQAEAQREDLQRRLLQHQQLQTQLETIRASQQELTDRKALLENHRQALEYTAAREGMQRLEEAKTACQSAQTAWEQLHARCQMLPSEEFAGQQLQQLRALQTQQAALDAESLPTVSPAPAAPKEFAGMTPEEALNKATSDKAAFDQLSKAPSPVFGILAAVFAAAGIGLALLRWYFLIPCVLLSALMLILHLRSGKQQAALRDAILSGYGTLPPEQWIFAAQKYSDEMHSHVQQETAAKAVSDALQSRQQALRQNLFQLTQGASPEETLQKWDSVIQEHQALAAAKQTLTQAKNRVIDLSAAIKPAQLPELPDTLTLSEAETDTALQDISVQLHHLQRQEGQCIGQKETLGAEAALTQQLNAVNARIGQLEDTYSALTVAMETLTEATNELQRKFAPRIAARAQALFGKLTGGRYDRLQLTQDLSLNTAAEGEDSLASARWRSEGTIDQLYLALRLAVAEALTPQSPLVLDDALVRFDDTRLASAMELLTEAAEEKQVILFSCQTREQAYLSR